jgi:hypothetical protein
VVSPRRVGLSASRRPTGRSEKNSGAKILTKEKLPERRLASAERVNDSIRFRFEPQVGRGIATPYE